MPVLPATADANARRLLIGRSLRAVAGRTGIAGL